MAGDPFNLQRFVTAHEGDFDRACAELQRGRKETHWMWFVFPQIEGLGRSHTAQFYAISGLIEARAYLGHPLLGPRLVRATNIVLQHDALTVRDIFGAPDDLKFRSSMTLFKCATHPESLFAEAITLACAGEEDPHTLARLNEIGSDG